MKRILAAVIALALSLPGLASALVYSPTVADLAGWTAVGNSSPSNTFSVQIGSQAVKFKGDMYGQTAEPSLGYIAIGKNLATPLDLSTFSRYGLHIFNVNESLWNYSLYAMDGMGYMAVTSPFLGTPIVNGNDAVLQLDLAAAQSGGMDLSDIISIGFYISQVVPIPAPLVEDRTYETIVAPVPEPGTMMLLGAGFLGMAIYGKRRKNA